MVSLENNGLWWIPSNPKTKISGKLIFSTGGAGELSLNGSFFDIQDSFHNIKTDIIFGVTSSGELFTLENCYSISNKFSFPGYITSNYSINAVFQGIHNEKPSDLLYKSLVVNYSQMEDWFRFYPLTYNFEKYDSEDRLRSINIKDNSPISLNLSLFTIKIGLNYSLNLLGKSPFTFQWDYYVEINPLEPMAFDDIYKKFLFPFQNYLSLGLGKPVYLKNISGILYTEEDINESEKIEIFHYFPHGSDKEENIPPFDILFSYGDVSDVFEQSLEKWLKSCEKIESVIHYYYIIKHDSNSLLNYKFISLMQTIELYHRLKFKGKYVENSEYESIKNHFIESIPDDLDNSFIESLKGKFSYLNEYSQRKRLKEIIETLDQEYENTLTRYIPNIKNICDKAIITRNYYTHHDEGIKSNILTGKDFFYCVMVLEFILELCLLKEIGISSNKLVQWIQKTNKYSGVKNFYKFNPE